LAKENRKRYRKQYQQVIKKKQEMFKKKQEDEAKPPRRFIGCIWKESGEIP
jgi:hypothetical protein